MQVKAKFRCYSKVPNGYNTAFHFHAVYGTEGENADFSKATPSGSLSINVDNGTIAASEWEEGKDYYLTFEKVQ
jgi:hypothetical protein